MEAERTRENVNPQTSLPLTWRAIVMAVTRLAARTERTETSTRSLSKRVAQLEAGYADIRKELDERKGDGK